MKKTYIGGILILVSAIIYGSMLISASIYSKTLTTEGVGWDSEYGIFGTALKEIGNTPIIISIFIGNFRCYIYCFIVKNKRGKLIVVFAF